MPVAPDAIDFDVLTELHATKALQLTTTVGMSGFIHLDSDPHALVTELLRLGRIGQAAEKERLGL